MKSLPGRIRQNPPAPVGKDVSDTFFFSPAFADQGTDASSLVPWEARANEVGAWRRGAAALQATARNPGATACTPPKHGQATFWVKHPCPTAPG